jgi:hypothetical protein
VKQLQKSRDNVLHVQYGILAGSLSSGEVVLWDPMAIVNQASAVPAIHTWKPSENGQVLAYTSLGVSAHVSQG